MQLVWPLLLLFVMIPICGYPAEPDLLLKTHCHEKIEEWLNKTGASKQHWRRQVDPEPLAKSYRTNTSTFGIWVEVHIFSNGQIEAYRITPERSEEVTWNGACHES